ncbi:TetR family transcriptional regulator (plasmid) [Streptomyces sp. NBC_01450]|uniref:TetR family transcriptional regulator n=1 Tax=Streptomyces sp. NBC_01450 TaxID=2903871 RepID=UPI002E38245A|nr:TetR family transcriptional regulator [Streptomyces sp. NBC_01450]
MRLFLEQGFDQVPVEQIAAEAGLSRTTFFRYFPTKEDVVLFQHARNLEKQREWRPLFAPEVARRLALAAATRPATPVPTP